MVQRVGQGIPFPELLFAALILGLMAAVAIPPMVYSRDTRDAECQANVELLNAQIQRYSAGHDGWSPADTKEFADMIAADKDRPAGRRPRCPYGQAYVYDPMTGRIVPHRH